MNLGVITSLLCQLNRESRRARVPRMDLPGVDRFELGKCSLTNCRHFVDYIASDGKQANNLNRQGVFRAVTKL